jgi:hypothetical protein
MNLSHERFVRILASLKPDDVCVDNRVHPRVALRSTVFVAPCQDGKTGPAFAVRLVDVSSGGAAFTALKPVAAGSQFVVDFPEAAPGGQEESSLRVLARVVHCRPAGEHQFHLGLQYVRLWTAESPSLDAARVSQQ